MLGMSDTSAPFGFTFGASHVQTEWSDFRRVTWPQLVETLTSHVPGVKDGSCIVPAQFRGTRRHKDDAARIDVAFLDSDSGMTLGEIEAALKARGWEAVISSTHSHMSTQTKVAIANWDRFFANHPYATPVEFLIDDKGYDPRIVEGAESVETTDKFVIIEHQPCPKFRVAVPLERPWLAENYPSQAEANAAWKERIEALAAALHLPHDQACTDTSRLFYLPRRPANGVVPETAVVAGAHCDIFKLPKPKAPDGSLFDRPHSASTDSRQAGSFEWVDPVQGEVIDLTDWAKTHGQTFLVAKALKARRPGCFTGHVSDSKVHIDCPNANAHTDPVRDGATYVVNAGSPSTKSGGFVIHCRHGHCTGKDRLFFVQSMLEQGWLAPEDLTDPRFNGSAEKSQDQSKAPLPLIYFNEIEVATDVQDFVEGVLTAFAMSVIYGQSNSGKTFWACNLALHIAAGALWNGREVERGGVIWLAMEGAMGIKNRIMAWKKANNVTEDLPFAIVPVALDLLDPDADTSLLISTIAIAAERMGIPVVLVVVDTLARAIAGGNENSSEDMGALVTNGTRIQQVAKCHVMWIHHSGKDEAKGARGHSSLRAATDTEIEIVSDGTNRVATVKKQREMECSGEFGFRLKVVELEQNRRGKMVTSCVVEGLDEGHTASAVLTPRLNGHNQRALVVLRDLLASAGKSGFPGTPSGVLSAPAKWWKDRFEADAMPGAEEETKRKAFQRASGKLIQDRIVGMANNRVWIVRHEHVPATEEGDTDA
jgi:AAA domain